jgi:acetyl-CoA carboxylase carboxyl transferase subunit alpha
MNITASKLQALKLIDSVVEEPLGGAHRDYDTAAQNLRNQLLSDLEQLSNDSTEELLSKRFDRLMSYGYC